MVISKWTEVLRYWEYGKMVLDWNTLLAILHSYVRNWCKHCWNGAVINETFKVNCTPSIFSYTHVLLPLQGNMITPSNPCNIYKPWLITAAKLVSCDNNKTMVDKDRCCRVSGGQTLWNLGTVWRRMNKATQPTGINRPNGSLNLPATALSEYA